MSDLLADARWESGLRRAACSVELAPAARFVAAVMLRKKARGGKKTPLEGDCACQSTAKKTAPACGCLTRSEM